MDALFAKSRFFTKTGEWTLAFSTYDEILAKPKSSTGKKIDALMEKSRICFFNTVRIHMICVYCYILL